MSKKINILLCYSIVLIVSYACSIKWTDAIQRGEVYKNEFKETVDIEVVNGLIIVPVNQTAFVGNFESNPVIKYLEIDGSIKN